MKKIDLTGQRFAKLLVVKDVRRASDGGVIWECVCDCGNTVNVSGYKLRSAQKKDCGCFSKPYQLTHGASKTPTYDRWNKMKGKAKKEDIEICDRWLEPRGQGFLNFLEDMGKQPPDSSIERIDESKGYSPENCQWTDRLSLVRSYLAIVVNYKGKSLCLAHWGKRLGFSSAHVGRVVKAKGFTEGLQYLEMRSGINLTAMAEPDDHAKVAEN